MCICINCEFYKSCWIKKGLNRIPKNFLKIPLTFNYLKLSKKDKLYKNLKQSLNITINLNSFCSRQTYEFDVTECEGFCESPGYWLN
jgi:hypothetical protein